MKEAIRLSRCLEVIETYSRSEPLATHLKKYFARHKEMGSTDRRITRELVYNFYRLGAALKNEKTETRLAVANFIFNDMQEDTLKFLVSAYTHWTEKDLESTAHAKFNKAVEKYASLRVDDLFPFANHLSATVDPGAWMQSFFIKPLVWVRARKNALQKVLKEFETMHLVYIPAPESELAFGFEAAVKITETASYKKGLLEIQDLSSQLTGKYFTVAEAHETWWDCCAGAGGKSLLLLDHHPHISLTVSDIREPVLLNLQERFHRAGLKPVKSTVIDLTDHVYDEQQFSSIILDVPCSGSGTWNRTPEMISGFSENQLADYTAVQKTILSNIIPSLEPGGKIIYITCSVFKEENEEIVDDVVKNKKLICEQMHIIPGYLNRSDTMFAAVLKRPPN